MCSSDLVELKVADVKFSVLKKVSEDGWTPAAFESMLPMLIAPVPTLTVAFSKAMSVTTGKSGARLFAPVKL